MCVCFSLFQIQYKLQKVCKKCVFGKSNIERVSPFGCLDQQLLSLSFVNILSSKNLSNLKFCQLSKDCSDTYLLSFSSFRIQLEVKVSSREDLHDLEMSETRILLLYSTRQEGSQIMKWAKEAGLTAKSYVTFLTRPAAYLLPATVNECAMAKQMYLPQFFSYS